MAAGVTDRLSEMADLVAIVEVADAKPEPGNLQEAGDPVAKDFYDRIVAIITEQGCWQVPGGKGSHEKWFSPINGRTVTVPRSKSRHTANEVLKQLGIGKKF